MIDDHELMGLDPFAILDLEALRLDAFFCSLNDSDWTRTSRCRDWTVRDVLGHLLSSEDYHRACLEGTVAELLARFEGRGATDLDSANALGVADCAGLSSIEALARWRIVSTENRRRFRERGDGTVDTSVGDYPCRWQAFHVASELATHADDVEVPVGDDERHDRRAWRARFSRFALGEAKPNLNIHTRDGHTVVADHSTAVTVDDDDLIAGVMGRLDERSPLDAVTRALLSTMP